MIVLSSVTEATSVPKSGSMRHACANRGFIPRCRPLRDTGCSARRATQCVTRGPVCVSSRILAGALTYPRLPPRVRARQGASRSMGRCRGIVHAVYWTCAAPGFNLHFHGWESGPKTPPPAANRTGRHFPQPSASLSLHGTSGRPATRIRNGRKWPSGQFARGAAGPWRDQDAWALAGPEAGDDEAASCVAVPAQPLEHPPDDRVLRGSGPPGMHRGGPRRRPASRATTRATDTQPRRRTPPT